MPAAVRIFADFFVIPTQEGSSLLAHKLNLDRVDPSCVGMTKIRTVRRCGSHPKTMNRRSFIQTASFLPTLTLISQTAVPDPMDRIAMSTVNFRRRFVQTAKNNVPVGQPLTLLDIPSYFRQRFGLKNLEFWSRHFVSTEPAYLRELKRAIDQSKSRLVNIQMDERYQIGDPDPVKRKESLDLALRWVEVAKTLGSECIRINPGKGELGAVIESYKVINEAARKHKIVLLVENHFGIEMDPDVHLKIVDELGQNAYTLPDFGNYTDDVRFDALKKLMLRAYMVSAKTTDFDGTLNHTSYDFDRCMKIAAESGFQGIYSVEQWSRNETTLSDEALADWMIARVKPYVV
jgi:sugar phosphate isomerase/epimerase